MISIISDHLSCQGSTLGSLGFISFNHPLRWLRERQRHLRASGDGAAAAAAFGCPKKGWVYWRGFTTPRLGVCYAKILTWIEKTRKKLGYTNCRCAVWDVSNLTIQKQIAVNENHLKRIGWWNKMGHGLGLETYQHFDPGTALRSTPTKTARIGCR